MKKSCLSIVMCVLALVAIGQTARAQSGAKQGPEVVRDPDLERDSMHNLEVARQYFKLKKAYVASLQRCEEVIAGNQTFSKIDEVLFIAGESSFYLSQNKGRQSPSLYPSHEGGSKHTLTAEQFRNLARDYLSQLVSDHPESAFSKQAEEDLKTLGGPKPKAEGSKQ